MPTRAQPQGPRETQEDRVTLIPDLSALAGAVPAASSLHRFAFFGVFDGHGG